MGALMSIAELLEPGLTPEESAVVAERWADSARGMTHAAGMLSGLPEYARDVLAAAPATEAELLVLDRVLLVLRQAMETWADAFPRDAGSSGCAAAQALAFVAQRAGTPAQRRAAFGLLLRHLGKFLGADTGCSTHLMMIRALRAEKDGRAYLAHVDRRPEWDLPTELLTHQLGTLVGVERCKLGLGEIASC